MIAAAGEKVELGTLEPGTPFVPPDTNAHLGRASGLRWPWRVIGPSAEGGVWVGKERCRGGQTKSPRNRIWTERAEWHPRIKVLPVMDPELQAG